MTTTTTSLFQEGRQACALAGPTVGYREDGSVILVLGPGAPQCAAELTRLPENPRFVHYHPLKSDGPPEALSRLQELAGLFPGCQIHGLSPAWLQRSGARVAELKAAGLASLCWFSGSVDGPEETPALGWRTLADLDIPKVATFLYGPKVTREQVEQRVGELLEGSQVAAIVPLPRGLGDRIMVASATTSGILDVSVLMWTQALCQKRGRPMRVRASWGALGWKMAQPTLAFGVNELAGWGLEEVLAYGPKARPSSQIGVEEVELGIGDLGRKPRGATTCAWDF